MACYKTNSNKKGENFYRDINGWNCQKSNSCFFNNTFSSLFKLSASSQHKSFSASLFILLFICKILTDKAETFLHKFCFSFLKSSNCKIILLCFNSSYSHDFQKYRTETLSESKIIILTASLFK